MLGREICERLRDAGWPQEWPTFGYVWDRPYDEWTGKPEVEYRLCKVWNYLVCNSGFHNWDSDWSQPSERFIACPTTDELLAAIQERVSASDLDYGNCAIRWRNGRGGQWEAVAWWAKNAPPDREPWFPDGAIEVQTDTAVPNIAVVRAHPNDPAVALAELWMTLKGDKPNGRKS